jgi:hypothetical protein
MKIMMQSTMALIKMTSTGGDKKLNMTQKYAGTYYEIP